ncbi:MAG TPA: 5'-methylthioadenosine nucleosidase [Pusillimonas sp.]|mgnify:FL=1|jgi:adenosylhomocysteine nucleosidase|nr:5'-methylthioadenosine nucleosidase [Pusillimonas sp.]MBC41987.1 5'-methylthioadenosine nucleosidase [Pusillimonas sp.]HBT31706.1 5'-methylthioadenosine nucleosidase [Pusillimonas sp.]HCN70948.1 5'-methylthioadenosine nucleosidase [Pusillimonas sp.]HCP79534.1 5'-methylthioadenosine nucleosidase [Pusillimonas sp.]|tara:strand:- start:29996 stop:30550 length:555 start_codon:yes stop_codon:yes gene_type:complete
MRTNIVVVTALPEELGQVQMPDNISIYHSGIGKINATMAVMKAIYEKSPSLIVNFGTAGSVVPGLQGLLPISRAVQRDVITTMAPRGQMPYCPRPQVYASSVANGYTCGTGDSFVTAPDPWFQESGVEVVDMELFAIAAVAHEHGVPWLSYKYVTDYADEEAVEIWKRDKHLGQQQFLDVLTTL